MPSREEIEEDLKIRYNMFVGNTHPEVVAAD